MLSFVKRKCVKKAGKDLPVPSLINGWILKKNHQIFVWSKLIKFPKVRRGEGSICDINTWTNVFIESYSPSIMKW